MKKFNLLCAFALIWVSLTCCASSKIEEKLEDILNEFRHRLCYELERFDIPALDPFALKELNGINISGFKIDLKDLSVNGLSDFEVKNIKIRIFTFNFLLDIVVPKFVLKTKYSINGKSGLLNLNGTGDLTIEMLNPGVLLETSLKYSIPEQKSSFAVKKLKPSIEKIKFNITGLFPNEETNKSVNQIITDIGLDLVREYYDQNEEAIKSQVENLLTKRFEHLHPRDIVEVLVREGPIFDEENDPKPNCKNKISLFNNII